MGERVHVRRSPPIEPVTKSVGQKSGMEEGHLDSTFQRLGRNPWSRHVIRVPLVHAIDITSYTTSAPLCSLEVGRRISRTRMRVPKIKIQRPGALGKLLICLRRGLMCDAS